MGMETKMQATIIGITDEVNHCDCCGKSNLKRTVILKIDGEVQHYGCDCASRLSGQDRATIQFKGQLAGLVAKYGVEKVEMRYGNLVNHLAFEMPKLR